MLLDGDDSGYFFENYDILEIVINFRCVGMDFPAML